MTQPTDPTSPKALLDAVFEAIHGTSRQCLDNLEECREEGGLCWRQARQSLPAVAAWLRARSEHVPDAYDSRYGPDIDTARGMCRALDEAADAIDEAVTSRA